MISHPRSLPLLAPEKSGSTGKERQDDSLGASVGQN